MHPLIALLSDTMHACASLFLQSFFTSMTTNLCEALVCGKEGEAMFLIDCPIVFVSCYFSDIFRALIARNVRATQLQLCAIFLLSWFDWCSAVQCSVPNPHIITVSQVFAMGIYKSPSRTENSVMPFVCTCPEPKTILNRLDKLFVYGNFEKIKLAEARLNVPFICENGKQRLGVYVWYKLLSFVQFN
jgi:hypothetical protein